MTVDDLVQCARPILWENDIEEYPYSIGATCFIFSQNSEFYAATVRHNLSGRNADDLLIPYDETWREFLPIEGVFSPSASKDQSDREYADLVIMKIKAEMANISALSKFQEFDFHSTRNKKPIPENGKLYVAGYPGSLQKADYEERRIKQQRFIFDGNYGGKAESYFSELINFEELSALPEPSYGEPMDGLSGSPVFFMDRSVQPSSVTLAGILNRGTKQSLMGRFLNSELIWKAMSLITNGEYQDVESF
jgi:hypothetical protein